MGDAFTNWSQTAARARDYQASIHHDAETVRRSRVGRRRPVFAPALDALGRGLIAFGRSLRHAAGEYTAPNERHAVR